MNIPVPQQADNFLTSEFSYSLRTLLHGFSCMIPNLYSNLNILVLISLVIHNSFLKLSKCRFSINL